ncbi:MAG: hypothetical protein AABZ17_06910, partial [Nitrospirota bacterium]
PGSGTGQRAVLWGLVLAGLCVPWMGTAGLAWMAAALEAVFVLGCVVCLGVGLWALVQRDGYAAAGLFALAPWWILIIADALRAYIAHNGLLDAENDGAWRKLACLAAARLLHVATECAEQGVEHNQWPVRLFVDSARAIASDPALAGAQLRQWGDV